MLVALLTLANKASWKDAGSYMEIAKHTEEELDRSLCHTYTHTHMHTQPTSVTSATQAVISWEMGVLYFRPHSFGHFYDSISFLASSVSILFPLLHSIPSHKERLS